MSELKPLIIAELNPPMNITTIHDKEGLAKLTAFFERESVLGFDIETTPLKDYFFRRCRTIQFGNSSEQYVIDLLSFCGGDADLLFASQGHYGASLNPGLQLVMDTLKPVVCSDKWLKVGVSLGFEYLSFYWLFGLRTYHFWDCGLVEKCIWAGAHSMKDYGYYSMAEMGERYFQMSIDKKFQESFTLDAELCDEQIAYAALDTRFPMAIRQVQQIILKGATYKKLVAAGNKAAARLKNIDPLVTGDNLEEIAEIENDAIGAFEDMHVHGERLDRVRWLTRIAGKKTEREQLIQFSLDPIFIPIVGTKAVIITDEMIEASKEEWKVFNVITPEELVLKGQIKAAAKLGNAALALELEMKRQGLEDYRKAKKEVLKTVSSELGKKRTKIKNLMAKCEGQALINYGSDAQLLAVINGMKGLKSVTNMDDETLEKFSHFPVMAAIRRYHGLTKEIGTYGDQWAMEWGTKPCKEEGWLHPGDGRLHCVFNQYDAETGRSSSEKPNGQNLPKDKEVRECFIVDPPDESIRISDCHDADTVTQGIAIASEHVEGRWCTKCGLPCSTHAEEYVMVTADMSGAELRIIAELAEDPVWIGAFDRGEDVHSVGTEILYEEQWPAVQLPGCAYFALKPDGTPAHKKCKCPEHEELRGNNKSTNFLLAYGGGFNKLAQEIKKAAQVAKDLMALHERKFPRIWAYLAESGRRAKLFKRSFDMYGRRRLFPEPTNERAKKRFIEDKSDRLELKPEEAEANIAKFILVNGKKPNKEELWPLEHRQPTSKEISSAFVGLSEAIGRQGKNHAIQGTNATVAKKAMGSGHSPDGKPYLWHTLPKYKAKLLKFVHDELVVQCPKRFGEVVADLIGDAFKRAAAEKMKKVSMEFDYNINTYWQK